MGSVLIVRCWQTKAFQSALDRSRMNFISIIVQQTAMTIVPEPYKSLRRRRKYQCSDVWESGRVATIFHLDLSV